MKPRVSNYSLTVTDTAVPEATSFWGCQRFWRPAEAFACFLGDVTFAVGTITLCTGITLGCPASNPLTWLGRRAGQYNLGPPGYPMPR